MSDELKELLRKAMLTDGGAKRKKGKSLLKASGNMDLNLLGPVADTSTIKQLVKQAIQEELAVEATGRMAVSRQSLRGMGLGGGRKKKGKSLLKSKLSNGCGLGGGPVGGRKRGDLTEKEKK